MYLRVNFGHNLNEKDILRLIAHKLKAKLSEKNITNLTIIQSLKELNEDIAYSTEREREWEVGGKGIIVNAGSEHRTKNSRNVADAREIEMRLLDILEKIKDKIVVVFDELDKIEQGDTSNTKTSLFSISATRERQTEILKILSNLKYFLSTAKAKFIFIAGREMYDIYLADVSERSNYIGSIFNTVIYVPSFLTDKADYVHSDITSLTEEFVCLKLISKKYSEKYTKQKNKEIVYNLKSYREYLEEEIYKKQNVAKNKEAIQEIDQKIQKTIAVLQQLIIYLAHISKGAPKKMIQLFESFIEVGNTKKTDMFLTVENEDNKSEFFLIFDYYRQYALGMTAYLITPIFNRLSETNIREHSDKLLVSSLRFVDFLFKFHKHTFSWKNLEISPELLEINRSTELKSVAVDLLNYLTQTHINNSSFSLDDYKFDSLIANEIFAMTTTDEVFSALYSFSLDETLSLKEHYRNLLDKAQKNYENNSGYKDSTTFIYSIASLQVVLGDLHYYDDELEEAETYYENTIHTLRNLAQKNKEQKNKEEGSDETMSMGQLYLFVRNMLKLGLVLEKRKQYDFAYLTYGELCKRIIRERNIAITELKAGIALRKLGDKDVFVKTFTEAKESEEEKEKKLVKEAKNYYDNLVPREIIPTYDNIIEDDLAKPNPLYFKYISPNTNDVLFKKMTFEGLKLLYLPFIAKLQILEKSHVGGITRNHLEQLDREFEFLTYVIDHKEAKILEADFFSRVADVLYYKNSNLKCKKIENAETHNKKHSCTACEYYRKALFTLLNDDETLSKKEIERIIEESTPLGLLKTSLEYIKGNYNMKHCTVLARILSDWGNIFYSCDERRGKFQDCFLDEKCCYNTTTERLKKSSEFITKCINYVESASNEDNRRALLDAFKSPDDIIYSKMEIAFAMYAVSLKAYSKANLYKRSAYQINKMLRLFKSYKIYENFDELGKKAIRSLWCAVEELNIFELNKRKKDFGNPTIEDKIPLQYLLVDSEISKIPILVKELELKKCKKEYEKNEITDIVFSQAIKKYYDLHITSPYSINYSISSRIYQLRLKAMVNYEAYKMLVSKLTEKIEKYNGKIEENSKNNTAQIEDELKTLKSELVVLGASFDMDNLIKLKSEINYILNNTGCNDIAKEIFEKEDKVIILESLIAESIFCLKEIIRLSKTIGETYMFNHSFMGATHDKLSFWVRRYETYKKVFCEEGKKYPIDEYLEEYNGEEWEEKLSGYYENQQALSHYYKCLETHSEGRAYHNMIDKMCYIKDDYNDRSDHFNIAEERHYILNDRIKPRINAGVKKCYEKSKLYKVENYLENS